MWLISVDAEAAFAIGLVLTVVAVEVLDFRIALEGEDVRCDAVKKPTIVAYYDRTAGKVFKRLFKSTHCVYIEIICGLVEENDVSTGF